MPFGAKKSISKEVSDMESDHNNMPKTELLTNEDCGVRLFAYSCAISRKEGRALPSQGIAKEKAGIAGLRDELEKTKLDV